MQLNLYGSVCLPFTSTFSNSLILCPQIQLSFIFHAHFPRVWKNRFKILMFTVTVDIHSQVASAFAFFFDLCHTQGSYSIFAKKTSEIKHFFSKNKALFRIKMCVNFIFLSQNLLLNHFYCVLFSSWVLVFPVL